MSNHIKILFFLNVHKANSEGLCPLILRITLCGRIRQISSGFYLSEDRWDNKAKRVKGNKPDADQINKYILATTSRLLGIYNEQLLTGEYDLDTLIDKFLGKYESHITLLHAIRHHNENFKERIGIDFSFSTFEKYDITRKKIEAYLAHIGKKDIRLKELSIKFIADFELFLKKNESNQHNTAAKYCKNLKRILNYSVQNGWIEKSPFNHFTCTYKETNCTYLLPSEIKLIEEKAFLNKRLSIVKDLFLFQCYTGLSYVDMAKLSSTDISVGIDGNQWIFINRSKTGTKSKIPLISAAISIINKYSGACKDQRLLPVYSIQKFNSYLEEIADLCGINKKISSHVGRRTFGNLALINGVSLNVIAKILGHTNTVTTQKIYAITSDQLISKEFESFKSKLDK